MKQKKGLLPRLAIMGIRKNGSTYLPYIGISIFAIFTYFVFDLILNNDVVMTIPRAMYAYMLMTIGFGLLSVIMIPFLYYTNSFLIKRRKKELGLYSILGLEKKHIGIMMFLETLIIYVIVLVCAVALGLLFSKLIFLVLLNLAKLPVSASFSFSWKAFFDTVMFYAVVCGINLFANLVAVGKANPTELMSDAKKGEKEPKHIFIWTILGLLCTGWGYYLAIKAQMNSEIFLDFFLAVLMVILGTHFLFTSGSISLLRGLRKNKKFYYKEENFVTVSGMLYRMKKSAASLVNICIFATMSIITVICTVSLYLGIPGITAFVYPFDIEINFLEATFTEKKEWKNEMEELAAKEDVSIEDFHAYSYMSLGLAREDNRFLFQEQVKNYENWHRINLLTLEMFNELEGTAYELGEGEVLVYSNGPDYGLDSMVFGDQTYRVREELQESKIEAKADNNTFGTEYTVVVPDGEILSQIAVAYGSDSAQAMGVKVRMNVEGSTQQIQAFMAGAQQLSSGTAGFASFHDQVTKKQDMESMYGGLLFIGVFYGLIFFLCLLVIMYYKQITEGFEDQKNFEIMQKVGMSDNEVKRTIRKQILLVFFLPLLGAVLHTAVGMNMVIKLMGAINLFQTELMILSTVGVCCMFALLYAVCYNSTARTYYRIVKQMA